MSVRIDKWLQVARVFKTRSQATRACTLGRVRINGNRSKPHRLLKIDDRIEVVFGDWQRVLVVLELRDRPLPKKDATRVFEDLSEPRPRLDPFERAMRRAPVQREKGLGRPTKQERREIDRLREGR